jgi:hypothetical protein
MTLLFGLGDGQILTIAGSRLDVDKHSGQLGNTEFDGIIDLNLLVEWLVCGNPRVHLIEPFDFRTGQGLAVVDREF